MKYTLKLYAILFASALLFTACEDPLDKAKRQAPDPEIRSLTLTNGGLAGTDRIAGTIDQEALTVVFENVAAETEFSAITFESNLSIGAELTKSSYDFLTGQESATTEVTQQVTVYNPDIEKEKTYTVTLKLKAPESAPVLDKMVVKGDDGIEKTLTMTNVYDNLLMLGMGESQTCEVVSVTLKPARATYQLSNATSDIISQNNPGTMTLDFMGLKTVYELSWAASPNPGADFTKAVVHDFTTNSSIFSDFTGEDTRGADMDENYILIVNKLTATDPNPYLLLVDDVLNDNTSNKIALSTDGIEGGTFYISAGRLTQGHVFCCNLPALGVNAEGTGDGPLKVYHWATPQSKPEVVLAWDGTGITNAPEAESEYHARLGDNISISLDQNGNGYAFFSQQEGGGMVFRFTVKNFTDWSEPFKIQLPAVANYYGMYHKAGENEYIFKAVYVPTMWLFDSEGTKLATVTLDGGKDGGQATDFRIVQFNRGRYLMGTNARRFAWYAPEALVVYDITEGMTNAEALKIFMANKPVDPESDDPDDPDFLPFEPTYKYLFDSGTISQACVALCNAVEKNGKLLIFTAAPHAGMALIEVPKID